MYAVIQFAGHQYKVKEGDKVIFSSYAGDEINIGDEDYLLLRESDIMATV